MNPSIKYMGILLFIFGIVSVIASVVTVVDKLNAIGHKQRVPENTLLIIAALGGAVAMLAVMLIIRHKTLHRKFMCGLPIIIFFHAIIVLWLNYRVF